MKTRLLFGSMILLSSAAANAGLTCNGAGTLYLSNQNPDYDPPYYVGEPYSLAVAPNDASFQWQTPSGTINIGTIAANTVVTRIPTQVGFHDLRASYLSGNCSLDEWVYALPSLGPISTPSGTLYTFTNLNFSVSGSGGKFPLAYAWDFDDGNTDSGPSAANQYEDSGTYVISVELTDDGGRTDTETKTIVVADNPNFPTKPGVMSDDWLGCNGSARTELSWWAPTGGATATTYWFSITGGGWSDSYWNTDTDVIDWLAPSTNYTASVRGCTSQSEATCGPARTHLFTSNECSGSGDD